MQVVANGTVIADSDKTVVIEGNHYFPPESVRKDLLSNSQTTSVCPWKGNAFYYSATVDGKTINDVAWYYPNPSSKAQSIQNYVAFYKNKVQFK